MIEPGFRQAALNRVCESRNLPNLKIGIGCDVGGRKGIIVGGNRSSNLSVLFDDDSCISNCHPHHELTIFNGLGGVCYVSEDIAGG